jgi:MFS family permease
MAQIMIMFALAPVIAPVIGGWLQTWFGWRAVFALLVCSASPCGWPAGSSRKRCPRTGASRCASTIWQSLPWRAELTRLPADLRRAGL